jgi:bifunctional non-homologous end joining protein LigD
MELRPSSSELKRSAPDGRFAVALTRSIPVALIVFDVLEVEGLSTTHQPYRERRATLELLSFGPGCHVSPSFEDGAALWESVCERRLEGVVAKKLSEPYRPGERSWVKKKNPGWSRYAAEREAVSRRRTRAR